MANSQLESKVSSASEQREQAEASLRVCWQQAIAAARAWYQVQDQEGQALVKELMQNLITTGQKWTRRAKNEADLLGPHADWPEDRKNKRAVVKAATIHKL